MIPRVQACLLRPTALGLAQEFARFGPHLSDGRYPCRRSRDRGIGGPLISNQCAVRMSVALCRSMNDDIFGSYSLGMLHSSRCCAGPQKTRHITRAQSMFDHLRDTLRFDFQSANSDPAELANRKGIIFFQHCYGEGNRGSHIDYWNGTTYTNSATGNAAASTGLGLFRSAGAVFFCALV